jgi:hypothetical protein
MCNGLIQIITKTHEFAIMLMQFQQSYTCLRNLYKFVRFVAYFDISGDII